MYFRQQLHNYEKVKKYLIDGNFTILENKMKLKTILKNNDSKSILYTFTKDEARLKLATTKDDCHSEPSHD